MNKTNMKKSIIKIIVLIVVCFTAECIISNFSAISLKMSNAEEYDVNLSSGNIELTGEKALKKDGSILIKNGTLLIKDLNHEMRNICVVLSGDYYEYTDVDISYLDDNFSYEDGYDYNLSYDLMYVGAEESNYFNVKSFGEVKNLKLAFWNTKDAITISKIIINKAPEFSFSFVRFDVLVLTALVLGFGLWKLTIEKNDYFLLKIFTVILCLGVCWCFTMIKGNEDIEPLDDYPSIHYSDEDQYTQLFESFKKGQLNLDLDYDVKKLEALDNPLDRSERNAKDATGSFWDRAYYKGKFYSYFGVAPVFTVYYPVNIITGKVPTVYLVSALLCIYAVIFISLLYIQLIRRFCPGMPMVLAFLGQAALVFGSAIFAAAFEVQFYYMAVISGVTWTAAFLYFLITAYYESNIVKRIIYLVLSGVSVVLIVASRPTLLFYGVVALVPAIFIMISKDETVKRKISYVSAIGVPVVIGAVLIMIYNYKRFENPFEFGFNYQLTVSIAKANSFSLSMIPAALYHYFFQQPNIKTKFPYMEIKSKTLETYHRYNYTGRTMGVFNYPITWGFFLTPVIYRKKDKFKTAFIITFAAAAVLMAYIDMCKAGSHYRYTLDILFPIILISEIVIFDILNNLKQFSGRLYKIGYVFTAIAMMCTVYIGYLMMFANERNKLLEELTVVGRILQNL